MIRLSILYLAIGAPVSSAAKVKRRFSAEPEKVKKETRDRDVKMLPPKFVAEKYGVKEGDQMNEDVARKIHEEAMELGERPPSFFHIDDGEVLLLPEVFSMLNTEKVIRDFAGEGDAKDEKELRDSRWWGRLYVEGWPQTIQYMRAHFGQPPPQGVLKVVLAEPADACGGLLDDQGGGKYAGAIVVARRGKCTFSSKARHADKANAAALVLVNTEPGNDHLAGPDAHDVGLSVSMVAQADGELLLRTLETNAAAAKKAARAHAPAVQLTAAMVPIHCTENSAVLGKETLGSDLCAPATSAERELAKNPVEGGWVTLLPNGQDGTSDSSSSSSSSSNRGGAHGNKFEFLIATFGTIVSAGEGAALEVVVAEGPWDTCDLLEGGGGLTFDEFNLKDASARNVSTNGGLRAADDVEGLTQPSAFLSGGGSPSKYAGKAVLIKRGGCPFIQKVKSVQAAGASAALVSNTHLGVSRFGVEPRWKGLGVHIPCVMVSDLAGAALAAAAALAGNKAHAATVSFTLSSSVTASAWSEVDALRDGDSAAWGIKKPKKAARSNQKAAVAGEGAERAMKAEALTAMLKARRSAGVDAGWFEREAAVMQGFEKLCPAAEKNSLVCPSTEVTKTDSAAKGEL